VQIKTKATGLMVTLKLPAAHLFIRGKCGRIQYQH